MAVTGEGVQLDPETFIRHLESLHAQQLAAANRQIAELQVAMQMMGDQTEKLVEQNARLLAEKEERESADNRAQRRTQVKTIKREGK